MSKWPAHLRERYAQQRPRKLLALDGGGIRGVLTLEILAEMERQLEREAGTRRLGEYFDYIAGTSTGAIIAAGLAIGMSAEQLLNFYVECGPAMFERASLLSRLKHFYEDEPLAKKLREIFHDGDPSRPADLGSSRLLTLLLVVTRNMTTDSPWPISTNPFAKYNAPERTDSNLRIPLWQLVRASTAAPVFFPPEVVRLNPEQSDDVRVFVDGGVTPYNNPAFLLYRMATQPAYRLGWKSGEDQLLLVSVGTGAAANVTTATSRKLLGNLATLPSDLMYGVQVDQDVNCRIFGRCVHGAEIDRELGTLVMTREQEAEQTGAHSTRLFRYARYNADLSASGLARLDSALLEKGRAQTLGDISPDAVQTLDAIDQIDNLRAIGKAVADTELDVRRHFGPFLGAV